MPLTEQNFSITFLPFTLCGQNTQLLNAQKRRGYDKREGKQFDGDLWTTPAIAASSKEMVPVDSKVIKPQKAFFISLCFSQPKGICST
jgi:hypothetical protein